MTGSIAISPIAGAVHLFQCFLLSEEAFELRQLSDLLLQTAALLFSEYICLAIMSFPYSYSVLGLVPGLIITVVVAGLVLYTSLIVW